MRYVIEGEWSGYTSSQSRVVHREVTTRDAVAEWVRKTHAIRYCDGTSLYLTVRPCHPRERVKEIHGYDKLLDDCRYYGVDSVTALADARKAKETVVLKG